MTPLAALAALLLFALLVAILLVLATEAVLRYSRSDSDSK